MNSFFVRALNKVKKPTLLFSVGCLSMLSGCVATHSQKSQIQDFIQNHESYELKQDANQALDYLIDFQGFTQEEEKFVKKGTVLMADGDIDIMKGMEELRAKTGRPFIIEKSTGGDSSYYRRSSRDPVGRIGVNIDWAWSYLKEGGNSRNPDDWAQIHPDDLRQVAVKLAHEIGHLFQELLGMNQSEQISMKFGDRQRKHLGIDNERNSDYYATDSVQTYGQLARAFSQLSQSRKTQEEMQVMMLFSAIADRYADIEGNKAFPLNEMVEKTVKSATPDLSTKEIKKFADAVAKNAAVINFNNR